MLRGQGHKVTEAETVVHSTFPTEVTTSKYELTEHGNTLRTIINNLSDWEIAH
jgi:DNA-binding HxlR family transcriptional regulator